MIYLRIPNLFAYTTLQFLSMNGVLSSMNNANKLSGASISYTHFLLELLTEVSYLSEWEPRMHAS